MYAKNQTFISCVLCSFGFLLKNLVKMLSYKYVLYTMKDIFVSNLIKISFPCCLGVGAMAEVTSIVSLVKDHLERVA